MIYIVKKYMDYYKYYIILVILVSMIGISNYMWASENIAINAFDMSGHLTNSLVFYFAITHPTFNNITGLMTISNYYPPLLYIVTALVYIPFGTSVVVAIMTNIIFIALIAISVYDTGKELFCENTGLLAAFLAITFPAVIGLSRSYLIDVALFAMSSVFLLFLIKSNGFKDRKYTIAAGAVAGLGFLTKWTFFIFFIGPLVVYVSCQLWNSRSTIKKVLSCQEKPRISSQVFNAAIACTILILISSTWYVPNFSYYWNNVIFNANDGVSIRGDIEPASIFLLSYLLIMINNQTFLPIFILFLIGVFYAFYHKDKKALFLLACFILIYLLLSGIRNKDMRYSLPLLGYVSTLSVYWLFKIKEKLTKLIIIAFIVILVFSQFLMAYNGLIIPGVPQSLSTDIGQIYLQPHSIWVLTHPNHDDWKIRDINMIIDTDYKKSNNTGTPLVCVLPDNQYFSQAVFLYWAYHDGMNMRVNGNYVWHPENFLIDLNDSKYIITKDRLNASTPNLQANEDKVVSVFIDNRDKFEELKTFALPDGSNATIYKRV